MRESSPFIGSPRRGSAIMSATGVAPGEIMRRLLVCGCVGGRGIGLVEDEARRSSGACRTSKRRLPASPTEASWLARVAAMKASTDSGRTRTWTRVTCMMPPWIEAGALAMGRIVPAPGAAGVAGNGCPGRPRLASRPARDDFFTASQARIASSSVMSTIRSFDSCSRSPVSCRTSSAGEAVSSAVA
jgi:hypothetical protein